jgi:hypothetical protein
MPHRTMVALGMLGAILGAGASVPAGAQVVDSARVPAGVERATPLADATRAPAAAATRYMLVEVAGKPLPALQEKERRCREDVVTGSLTLRDDGRWLLETTTREACGDRAKEDRDRDDGTYSSDGSALTFRDDDGQQSTERGWGDDADADIDLDELESGTIAGDGTLRVQLGDARTTLVFRREP